MSGSTVVATDVCVTRHNIRGTDFEILRHLSLEVAPGEFVALVGPSGCGKTTFLTVVDGRLKPTDGVIEIDGRAVTGPGPDRAFVFQQDALFPWRTVMANIGLGLEVEERPKRAIEQRAGELAELVGLAGFEHHYPHELSGGMRQRVNVARALAVDPAVLLMDEPFSSLDAQTRELMGAELLRIWSEQKKTVLFVTHQIDEAVYLADRVAVCTARPAQVREVIDIELPRPRELEIKRTQQFLSAVSRIWDLIESDVSLK